MGRVKFLGPFFQKKCLFFHKKVPFQANIEDCPKFLKYALDTVVSPKPFYGFF